jgi:hypothetical protein
MRGSRTSAFRYVRYPDLDPNVAVNKDKLMMFGGSVTAKIPYDDAIEYFNQPGASYPDPTVL